MRTADFDFPLPEELIAREPVADRGGSALMVVSGDGGEIEHRMFSHLPEYLRPGDMLLLNNTRVLPCRLRGIKSNGRDLEVLLVRRLEGGRWEVLSAGGYSGPLEIAPGVSARIHGGLEAEFMIDPGLGEMRDVMERFGEMPLPPYLKRRARHEDRRWYQTEYAEVEGSIAAPTAGLHFTRSMLKEIEDKGVLVRNITLHVGKGTFMPVRVEHVAGHRMESENFEVAETLLDEISKLKGSLVAVGTTATRAIEAVVSGRYERVGEAGGGLLRGRTDMFITPGYEPRAVDAILTNFHLPRSTPLMLASAFAGREQILRAYTIAVEKSYRFFSYGDAMLIQ